jgi:4-alpha-glucanotransferase
VSAETATPANPALLRQAQAAGIAVQWRDANGRSHSVAPEVLQRLLAAMGPMPDTAAPDEIAPLLIVHLGRTASLPVPLRWLGRAFSLQEEGADAPADTVGGLIALDGDGQWRLPRIERPGYYRLNVGDDQTRLAVCPPRCFSLADALGTRAAHAYGLCAQTYSLRRTGDGGVGDFAGVAQLARLSAHRGAQAVMLSPVHALFTADPAKFSPYSPSNRQFLNPLHADPAAIFGEQAVHDAIARLGLAGEWVRLENAALIDWPAVARARLTLLRALFEQVAAHSHSALAQSFSRFRNDGGDALRLHAVFEALHRHGLLASEPQHHWRDWAREVREVRDPRGPGVHAFVQAHRAEVDFHCFLQWIADRSLAVAQATARKAGMAIGLVADLAVGADTGGSEAWGRQGEMLTGVTVGAPPDLINTRGQNWGLGAFSPGGLVRSGYAGYLALLQAAMAHGGGVRMDHVLGLMRLWLIPEGHAATDGAYVHYPLQDMMGLLALESWRHRAIVIGEDLGTVPDGLRDRMQEAAVAGMQVLWFEREPAAGFRRPANWSSAAVAMTTTHDLPTVAGWWAGTDIDWQERLGWCDDAAAARTERTRERASLWRALVEAGVADGDSPPPGPHTAPVHEALAFVGDTPSPLVMVPLEDVLALAEQPNIPGTIDEHPNWRRRLPLEIDAMFDDPLVRDRLRILAERAVQSRDGGAS